MTEAGQFVGPCYHCKTEMWLPASLYTAAKRSQRITFYCAYGHGQCFAEGDSDLDIARRERDRAWQQLAQRDDDIRALKELVAKERALATAAKATATKTRKRAAIGLCPCCNRSFRQVALHIKNKHPGFKAEEAA